MIVDLDTFKTFMDIAETDDSQNELLNIYLNAVDALFNELCDREFDSTSYTHEEHNGDGGKRLWLKNIPITAITQISSERIPAIKVKNTTSDAARCTIDVDVSAQTLSHAIAGGSSAATGSFDLTNASYDTLAELVTGINAIGSGWTAEIWDTDLNSIPSTELLEVMGLNCGVPRGGGDAVFSELDIPGTPLGDEYRIENGNMGQIYFPNGWPRGVNNVWVSYTAGYSATTMPHPLKMGVLAGCSALYQRGEEDGFGVSGFSEGALRVKYGEWLPDITLQMIDKYERKTVV
jgi:hypothetical protein